MQFNPDNDVLLRAILNESSPTKIKKYGRLVRNYNDVEWSKIRYKIMLDGLRLKFNQNNEIKQKLLGTGKKMIFEASKYDKIWGIGFYASDAVNIEKHRFGTNLLGQALMEVRGELV